MNGFQLNHIPKRSTLSDANKKKDVLVFENILSSIIKTIKRFFIGQPNQRCHEKAGEDF
ncbi:MAG: hypothetical protein ACOH2D_09225 [Gelidibacter sp.]